MAKEIIKKWIAPENTGWFKNELYVFKKEFELSETGDTVCEISAQSRYKLYINGALVCFGPCKGTREKQYLDRPEVKQYLKIGKNEIYVEVLRLAPDGYGVPSPVEGVMRNGLCALMFYMNCGGVEIKSDSSWLCARQDGITVSYCGWTYSAAVTETVDAKKCGEISFSNAKEIFDADTKDKANMWYGIESKLYLSERPIPFLTMEKKNIVFDGEFFDAGYLTFGIPTFKISGKGKVKIMYFECFGSQDCKIKNDREDRALGYETNMADTVSVDGEFVYSPFWFRTFRYMAVEKGGDVSIELTDFKEVNYPLNERYDYNFGNKTDNELWNISVRTLKRCMHESYEDCPYYEQLQYTMDTSLQMLFNYQISDNDLLARKAMNDFEDAQLSSGLMTSRYPCVSNQYITSFQLYYIFMVFQHYIRFGDINLVRSHLDAINKNIRWFSTLVNEDGTVNQSKYWDFVDWATPWVHKEGKCEGGDPLETDEGAVGIYGPMFAYFLSLAAKLDTVCGREDVAEEYLSLADKVKVGTEKYFYDEKEKMYADNLSHTKYSQQMQVWCVLSGLASGEKARQIMKNSFSLEAKSTFAFAYFYFRALYACGLYGYSEQMLDKYRSLIALHCTTVPEVPEKSRSECHAWGAIVLYEFSAVVLGVGTEDVNKKSVCIKPYIEGRDMAKGTVSTIAGNVFVSWKKSGDVFTIEVKSDLPCEKVIILPNGKKHTTVAGKVLLECKI